jgi:hypothetical protein
MDARDLPRGPRLSCGIGLLVLLLLVVPLATIEIATLFAAEHGAAVPPVFALRFRCRADPARVLHASSRRSSASRASTLAFIIVFVMLFSALLRAWGKADAGGDPAHGRNASVDDVLGGLAWFLMALRVEGVAHVVGTTMVILMILLVVKFTDIGAYFGGARWDDIS